MGVLADPSIRYAVIIGEHGEYSLCRADRCPPPGWHLEGTEGTRSECMACVQAHAAPALFAAGTAAPAAAHPDATGNDVPEAADAPAPALPAGRRRSRPVHIDRDTLTT